MTWLDTSDDGLVELTLEMARQVESAVDRAREYERLIELAAGEPDLLLRIDRLKAQCDAAKFVAWLGPQLRLALVDLGGSPGSRKKVNEVREASDRLKRLREEADRARRQ